MHHAHECRGRGESRGSGVERDVDGDDRRAGDNAQKRKFDGHPPRPASAQQDDLPAMLSVSLQTFRRGGHARQAVHPSRVQVHFQSDEHTARDGGSPLPGQLLGIRLPALIEHDNDQRVGRAAPASPLRACKCGIWSCIIARRSSASCSPKAANCPMKQMHLVHRGIHVVNVACWRDQTAMELKTQPEFVGDFRRDAARTQRDQGRWKQPSADPP